MTPVTPVGGRKYGTGSPADTDQAHGPLQRLGPDSSVATSKKETLKRAAAPCPDPIQTLAAALLEIQAAVANNRLTRRTRRETGGNISPGETASGNGLVRQSCLGGGFFALSG